MDQAGQVSFKQLIKNKQFLTLWLSQLVSNFGDWLALIALFSLVGYRLQGTPYEVSGIMISFIIPMAFLGPVAGVFVDRWDVKKTMIASDVLRAVIVALLVFPGSLAQIYLLIFLLSCVSCFFLPAQSVAIPLAVRKEELLMANALNAQTVHFNKVISPAIAGFLVGWAGEKACFYIDSFTFLFSAAMLATLALKPREIKSDKDASSVFKNFSEGLRFIISNRIILFVILSIAGAILAVGAFDALIVVYIRDVLSGQENLFGTLLSIAGIGTIIGTVIIGKFGQRYSKAYMVVLGILGLGVSIFIMSAMNSVPIVIACGFFFGLAVAYVIIPAQALMQEDTPPQMLGRVSSASISLMTVSQLFSFLVAGTVADWIGIRNLYYVVALILALTALMGFIFANHRLTRINPVTDEHR
jgi:MFS transporter, DHA3 family, macrolide efflux protein